MTCRHVFLTEKAVDVFRLNLNSYLRLRNIKPHLSVASDADLDKTLITVESSIGFVSIKKQNFVLSPSSH